MTSSQLHPDILWAQTGEVVYITIPVADLKSHKVEFLPQEIKFQGSTEDKEYAFDLPLYKAYDHENSRQDSTAQRIFLVIKKVDDDQTYWPRLHESGKKPQFIKVDFSRWRDEDDDEEPPSEFPAFDPSMQNLGGQGFSDEDEDDYEEEEEEEEKAAPTESS